LTYIFPLLFFLVSDSIPLLAGFFFRYNGDSDGRIPVSLVLILDTKLRRQQEQVNDGAMNMNQLRPRHHASELLSLSKG
jgi:hypothetical protein